MKLFGGAIKKWANRIYPQKDKFWTLLWFSILLLTALWNWLFLNRPAFRQVGHGFLNTALIALLVTFFSLLLAWIVTLILNFLDNIKFKAPYFLFIFLLNIIRSIPQIIGILFGYIGITYLIDTERLADPVLTMIIIAFIMSLFIFLEIVDLMRERIEHFKNVDFYNAMKVCGISERRIINFDILWKNSRLHIFNKLIAVFGMAVFLQCSVDFIVSVGLSTEVSSVNLPTTLGSLLAKIDSKQDILAIGNTLVNPAYFPKIFFEHLQGVTVAFLIVFTLLSLYKISNGYAERNRL
jgi:ABC-type dipeptide/oligopeptide/nickel transport system permease subunit